MEFRDTRHARRRERHKRKAVTFVAVAFAPTPGVRSHPGIDGCARAAHSYRAFADREGKRAFRWQIGTLIAILGLLAFAVILLIIPVRPTDDLGGLTGRLLVVVALGALGAYARRQADRHWQSGRQTKMVELALTSIDQYVEGLPEEKRAAIKGILAPTLFTQSEPPKEVEEPLNTGTVLDLLRTMLEHFQRK